MTKERGRSFSFPIFAAECAAMALTFLSPLKFASIAGVPEMPGTYWKSVAGILFAAWPLNVFFLCSALLLGLCLLALAREGRKRAEDAAEEEPFGRAAVSGETDKGPLQWYATGWFLLVPVSYLGVVNASTWDFQAQMTVCCSGMACYVLSLFLLLERRPEFARGLLWSVLAASLFSAASGLYQYGYGFEATRQFLYDESLKTGLDLTTGAGLEVRLEEQRVSADFAVCNVYAGYLASLLPVLLYAFWRFGEQYVEPPKLSRWVLSVPLCAVFLFLLKETGSRGGVLALTGGCFLLLFCMKMNWKWRILSILLFFSAIAGFIVLVLSGRGFNSMFFRFDYFQAAFRMMAEHPFCGTGWGDFFHDYTTRKIMQNNEAPHTPHNMILLFGSQTGIPGFLLSSFLLLLPCACGVLLLRRAGQWKQWKDNHEIQFAAVLTLGILIWSLDSLIELNFETPGALATAAALSLILLSLPGIRKLKTGFVTLPFLGKGKGKGKNGNPGKYLHRLAFLALCILALLSFFTAARLIRFEMAFASLFESANPRYAQEDAQRFTTPDQVVRLLERAVEAAPESPFPWAVASDFMLSRGNFELGELYLNETLRRNPLRAGFHFRKYRLLHNLPGRELEAEEHLKRAQELFPGNPEYYPPFSDDTFHPAWQP